MQLTSGDHWLTMTVDDRKQSRDEGSALRMALRIEEWKKEESVKTTQLTIGSRVKRIIGKMPA